jgi:hypothetical protein
MDDHLLFAPAPKNGMTRGVKRSRWGCPLEFHRIVSAPRSQTTPVRPLSVKILNLGCPVLDVFQGRG